VPHRREDDASDDRDQAQPLGERDLLSVDEAGDHGGEGGLGGLDDLAEGNGTGGESEHGEACN